MTLDEARANIGNGVVYWPFADSAVQQGVITSVNDRWVFVRYGSDTGSKATDASGLSLLSSPVRPQEG